MVINHLSAVYTFVQFFYSAYTIFLMVYIFKAYVIQLMFNLNDIFA